MGLFFLHFSVWGQAGSGILLSVVRVVRVYKSPAIPSMSKASKGESQGTGGYRKSPPSGAAC